MLNKLLFTHQKRSQLLVAIFGALFGMILVLTTLQFYFDIQNALNGGDINKPQYLVINKEVNMLNTLFGGQKGFTSQELDEIRKIKGVKDVAPLTASHFKVSVTMGSDGMQGIPGMYTELFFEAVPDEFIDVNSSDWKWSEGDSTVPIIIPRDYIKLYNFGFAPTQGLPQVTENIVGLANFRITIRGKKGNAAFNGKIAGFSERINTILAPQKFIDHANEQFAGVEPGHNQASRVIIQCEGQATNELADYFAANGYETSAESLRNSKLNTFLRIVMNVLVAIGGVILILSLLGFFQYSQILLSKSSYELETLTRIGYDHRKLAMRYINYYNLIFVTVLLVSITILWISKGLFTSYLVQKGFEIESGVSVAVLISGVVFTLIFILINAWSVLRELRRLAK